MKDFKRIYNAFSSIPWTKTQGHISNS